MKLRIESLGEERLAEALKFQDEIIQGMPNKQLAAPMTEEEFLAPIKGRDGVYFLMDGGTIAAMFVATCDIPEVLEEYRLATTNVMLIDCIMVAEKYRGQGLQKWILSFLEKRARKLDVDGLVATVHPDNIYSLRNFLDSGYEIINHLHIHGGPREIVFKKVEA